MRAHEFLLEATPDNLGEGALVKLGKAYFAKEGNSEVLPPPDNYAEYGRNVARSLFNYSGPKYLIWTVKQYTTDRHFKLEDGFAWHATFGKFEEALKARANIKRDINQYKNINELRTTLAEVNKDIEFNFYKETINILDPFTKNGQASWVHRGADYSIYHPKTWESSNALYRYYNNNGKADIDLCVTYGEDYFHNYKSHGDWVLTITQNNAYIAYFSNSNNLPSEFADVHNDHEYGIEFQISQFPLLKPAILKTIPSSYIGEYAVYVDPTHLDTYINDPKNRDAYSRLIERIERHKDFINAVRNGIITPEIFDKLIEYDNARLDDLSMNMRHFFEEYPEFMTRYINSVIFKRPQTLARVFLSLSIETMDVDQLVDLSTALLQLSKYEGTLVLRAYLNTLFDKVVEQRDDYASVNVKLAKNILNTMEVTQVGQNYRLYQEALQNIIDKHGDTSFLDEVRNIIEKNDASK